MDMEEEIVAFGETAICAVAYSLGGGYPLTTSTPIISALES